MDSPGFENIDTFNPQDTFGRNRNEDNPRTETRIRLLTSFQESYQEDGRSLFNPFRSQPQDEEDSLPHIQHTQHTEERSRTFPDASHEIDWPSYSKPYHKHPNIEEEQRGEDNGQKRRKLEQRIVNLQRAIQQQKYNDNIQDKLFDFLNAKISNRNNPKSHKAPDHDKLVEKVIDFMDSGEQFLNEYLRLKQMFKNTKQ